jgi:putative endonuclease
VARHGEELAAAHLRAHGFEILARNARTRVGEIDVIAFDGRTLVFAEVKSRRASARARPAPEPLAGLRPRQRARLRRLAAAWLWSDAERPFAQTIRFDAIGVVLDGHGRVRRLEHLEGAW